MTDYIFMGPGLTDILDIFDFISHQWDEIEQQAHKHTHTQQTNRFCVIFLLFDFGLCYTAIDIFSLILLIWFE